MVNLYTFKRVLPAEGIAVSLAVPYIKEAGPGTGDYHKVLSLHFG